ncbi:preprotein translocase subunit YajC [Kineococcus sp. TRM81007]|uniref:preprotein translocase subunit YajC n=1 Tax=Kineococcus sp. TRM81007 TaxID=2925831 RepID=UPI001F57192C|nr:preprotein translocase subunit YajC [Kineococcus sp. TRM81007]MCI2238985.1 preprotein translocase subunit YajC [Kineococcus sp. TRM81007]
MGGGGGSQLIFLLLMVALLVFMFSRTRKQQRAQVEMQNSVGPGAEVMTTSGTYGTVVDVDGDTVVLEIAPGVRTRWARRAVARVVTPALAPVSPADAVPGAEGGLDLRKPGQDPAGDDPADGGAHRA